MAAKVALDMKVFPVLADAESPVPLAKLAAAKPADPLLAGQSIKTRKPEVEVIDLLEFVTNSPQSAFCAFLLRMISSKSLLHASTCQLHCRRS